MTPATLSSLGACGAIATLVAATAACGEGRETFDGPSMCPAPDGAAAPPRPPALNEHTAVYADDAREMIVVGGNTAVPENCGFPDWEFHADTWIYTDDLACGGTWTRLDAPGPQARGRHAAAYGAGAVWVHGGRFRAHGTTGGYTVFGDLWRFDVAERSWRKLEVAGDRPTGRSNAALAWDEGRKALWLFGGNESSRGDVIEPVADLWRFDTATSAWTAVAAPGGPSPRLWHATLFDAQRDRLVVFGGGDETAFADDVRYFADLWAYDAAGSTWRRLAMNGAQPAGRFWSQLVHDTMRDRYLLFGGHDDQALGNRNDTWTYDPTADAWSPQTGGDTFNRGATDFCMFPADFTIVDRAQPERRNAHTLVWSASTGRALLYGGKTDCGAVDDVWSYAGGAWVEEMAASAGEVCHRWRDNAANCANLCF